MTELTETAPHPRASRALEVATATTALLLSAAYLAFSAAVSLRREAAAGQIDARFWPLTIGVTAVVISGLLLTFALIRPPSSREDMEATQPGGLGRVAASVLGTLAYIGIWSLGSVVIAGYRIELFPLATPLYLVAMMLLFGHRRIVGLIVYPLAVTGFIYLLFGVLLRVPL